MIKHLIKEFPGLIFGEIFIIKIGAKTNDNLLKDKTEFQLIFVETSNTKINYMF